MALMSVFERRTARWQIANLSEFRKKHFKEKTQYLMNTLYFDELYAFQLSLPQNGVMLSLNDLNSQVISSVSKNTQIKKNNKKQTSISKVHKW